MKSPRLPPHAVPVLAAIRRWLRPPWAPYVWHAAALAALAIVLLAADALCARVTLPVVLDDHAGVAALSVGGQDVVLGRIGSPTAIEIVPRDPVYHEYQLDGTDSTNNLTLDTAYLHTISRSPYYRFQAWMRDLDGLSQWRDLRVRANGRALRAIATPAAGVRLPLPAAADLRVALDLQRPETPADLDLLFADGTLMRITVDRNDRYISADHLDTISGYIFPVARAFFPTGPTPFAAMVLDTLVRAVLWALAALLAVAACDALVALLVPYLAPFLVPVAARAAAARIAHPAAIGPATSDDPTAVSVSGGPTPSGPGLPSTIAQWLGRRHAHPPRGRPAVPRADHIIQRVSQAARAAAVSIWSRLTRSLHPVALFALTLSFGVVAWIAHVQFSGVPHIYDASAYLFGAKMLAIGRLTVPLPPAADCFNGPFMVALGGFEFPQYAPGTSLALVPGVWLGVPWLVEPVLGTLALLGIGLVAARLWDRRVATLAVVLGALSPYYSYLAASYLSHAVALCVLVWGLWALLRFAQGGATWNLPLAAGLFGMGALTRDLVAVLFTVVALAGVLALHHRRLRTDWRRWLLPAIGFLGVALVAAELSLIYNAVLTGSPWVTPRSLFFAGDHWGFGPGVGFYGQHTLAAGLVNLDELLTSLQIDLYGWPFALTLALCAVPFLARRSVPADWFALAAAAILTAAWIGYFYHGIYLGPRYLFETLPFLLPLTARGFLALADVGAGAACWVGGRNQRGMNHREHGGHRGTERERSDSQGGGAERRDGREERGGVAPARSWRSLAAPALLLGLIACDLIYYLPRQLTLYHDYTGLSTPARLDFAALTHPSVHHAIVITDNLPLYGYTLFALNDPLFHGDVLYALATTPAQRAELAAAYPGRSLYLLRIAPDGGVRFDAIPRG